jgi:hypothetical protein
MRTSIGRDAIPVKKRLTPDSRRITQSHIHLRH